MVRQPARCQMMRAVFLLVLVAACNQGTLESAAPQAMAVTGIYRQSFVTDFDDCSPAIGRLWRPASVALQARGVPFRLARKRAVLRYSERRIPDRNVTAIVTMPRTRPRARARDHQ
jgi:hypothetical protein